MAGGRRRHGVVWRSRPIGLPWTRSSAWRKSKKLDQAEWARRIEAAAWSRAQDANATHIEVHDGNLGVGRDAPGHAFEVAAVGRYGVGRRLGGPEVDHPAVRQRSQATTGPPSPPPSSRSYKGRWADEAANRARCFCPIDRGDHVQRGRPLSGDAIRRVLG
ncbi:MAG: hypothetical protein M3256_10935 [Actinomycetota bacterium]|nr:hypothetical protein [Actinomycetota bacterium]